MLTIICGEDTAASRNYLNELKNNYQKKNYYLQAIEPAEVIDLVKGMAEENTLFGQKKIFITQNLDKALKRPGRGKKVTDPLFETLAKIAEDKEIELIDWENKSAWELKLKKTGILKEFKPSANIFKLTEICSPGNLKTFVTNLNALNDISDEQFIFIMLTRHIRNLILAKQNSLPANFPPWQKGKMYSQAKLWDMEKLIKFYEGLHRIDIASKTSNLSYGIIKALDILAVYFLT